MIMQHFVIRYETSKLLTISDRMNTGSECTCISIIFSECSFITIVFIAMSAEFWWWNKFDKYYDENIETHLLEGKNVEYKHECKFVICITSILAFNFPNKDKYIFIEL